MLPKETESLDVLLACVNVWLYVKSVSLCSPALLRSKGMSPTVGGWEVCGVK